MDFSGIMEWGASVIKQNLGQETDALPAGKLVSALQSLLGAQDGSLNLGSLVSNMQDCGLGDIVNSWLGTGSRYPLEVYRYAQDSGVCLTSGHYGRECQNGDIERLA